MDLSLPFFKKSKQNVPNWLQVYLAGKKEQASQQKQLISDTRFVVFDTETSGFNLKKDHLLSVGAVSVKKNCISLADAFEVVLNAPSTESKEHVEIHQILPATSLKGKSALLAMQHFIEYIGNDILVGHHVQFDLAMVSHYLKLNFAIKLHNLTVDTGTLAKRLENSVPGVNPEVGKNYTLDQLCKTYAVPATDRHNAAGDAFITAQLLLKMLNEAERRGITTVAKLIGKKRLGLL